MSLDIKEIDALPERFQEDLLNALQDLSFYEHLSNMLSTSSVVVERDGYQISFNSVDELEAVKDYIGTNVGSDMVAAI